MGKIGRDGFGDFVLHTLEQEGVDASGLRRADGIQTSATVVLVAPDGERSFLHCLGANAMFVSEDMDMELVRSADILVVAGSLLMPKLDGEPTAEVLSCLLYTSDAADDLLCVDLGGRGIIQ